MSLLERITTDPEVVHGRPAIRGTRVRVTDVLSLLAVGATEEEILKDYPYLTAEDIKACLEYGAALADHAIFTTQQRVRFLVDAQLPPALARLLGERGHLAEHVTDIGPGDAADRELWRYALENGAVLITKDEDFSDLALLGGPSPVIVWVRVGNTTRRALLEWFEPLIEQVVTMVDAGNPLIEIR